MDLLTIGQHRIPFRIRRNRRSRSISLRITAQGLSITAPVGQAVDAHAIASAKADWLVRHWVAAQRAAVIRVYETGQQLPYLEETLTLAVQTEPTRRRTAVRRDGQTLAIDSGRDHTPADLRAAVQAWYRAQARAVLNERAALLSTRYGLRYERIAIRDQQSRWGSCSSGRNLNFNYRLMLAPTPVVDYVITHELCHLVHMNHSPAFWRLVAEYEPQYKSHRQWLREFGHTLVL
jgi:predicted metal-dependent hydrolase